MIVIQIIMQDDPLHVRFKTMKVSEPYNQPNLEVIACVYNPVEQKWTCFSASDVSPGKDLWEKWKKEGILPPGRYNWEILEAPGKKRMVGKEECICFEPEKGEITWISYGKTEKEAINQILQFLVDDIKSVIETGRSEWHRE